MAVINAVIWYRTTMSPSLISPLWYRMQPAKSIPTLCRYCSSVPPAPSAVFWRASLRESCRKPKRFPSTFSSKASTSPHSLIVKAFWKPSPQRPSAAALFS